MRDRARQGPVSHIIAHLQGFTTIITIIMAVAQQLRLELLAAQLLVLRSLMLFVLIRLL
jgi:hypothetical protein